MDCPACDNLVDPGGRSVDYDVLNRLCCNQSCAYLSNVKHEIDKIKESADYPTKRNIGTYYQRGVYDVIHKIELVL